MTGTVDIAALVESFVGDPEARRNPRSTTAVREAGGARFHLKRAEHSLAAEAEALREAARVREVPGVRAVELAGFDASRNVLVTGHSEGVSLFNRIWNETAALALGRRPPGEQAELLARVASWLAGFHRRGATDASPEAAGRCRAWLASSFESKLDHAAAARALGGELVAAAAARVREVLAGDAFAGAPAGRVHGDFCLVNLLVAGGGEVRVLDFGDTREGFALEDLVRLWTSVWEVAECGGRRRRELAPALPRLLAAYGLAPGAESSPAFRLLRLWNAVSRICESVDARRRYRLSTRRIHRRLVAAHRAWMRRELGGR